MNFIRFIQFVADKLVGLVLLAGGALVLAWLLSPLPEWAAENATEIAEGATMQEYAQAYTQPGRWAHLLQTYMPEEVGNRNLWIACAAVSAVLGFLIFIPRAPKTVARVLRLGGEKGRVDVDMATIQDALNKVTNDLPEVKRARVKVVPARDKKSFGLESNLILLKNDERSAKELVAHIESIMINTARNFVGHSDKIPVRTFVRGVVRGKSLDMIDIASRPALGSEAPVQHQIEDKWSQNQAQPPAYLPDEEIDDVKQSEMSSTGYQPPQAQPTTEPAPTPEPEPEPQHAYNEVPKEDREPVDSIDNIIMVDGNDYEDTSKEFSYDDTEEEEKK